MPKRAKSPSLCFSRIVIKTSVFLAIAPSTMTQKPESSAKLWNDEKFQPVAF
jgi:hypothetical protein